MTWSEGFITTYLCGHIAALVFLFSYPRLGIIPFFHTQAHDLISKQPAYTCTSQV